MVIKHVAKGSSLWDIFTGYGWTNWSRVRILKNSSDIHHIDGKYLSKIQIVELKKKLEQMFGGK